MKKKLNFIILAIVALVVFCIMLLQGKEKPLCSHFDIGTVQKVVIYYPGDNTTIVEQKDMTPLIELLMSMKGKKTSSSNKDGYACVIELYHEQGEVNRITLTSEYYAVDGKYYKSDIDYCEDFRKVYEQIVK